MTVVCFAKISRRAGFGSRRRCHPPPEYGTFLGGLRGCFAAGSNRRPGPSEKRSLHHKNNFLLLISNLESWISDRTTIREYREIERIANLKAIAFNKRMPVDPIIITLP